MSEALTFWILGLGVGSIYAALAMSVVLTYRSATVVNFAYAAMALFPACVFYQLRADGQLVLPLVWIPSSFQLTSGPTPTALAFAVAILVAAVLGLFAHYAIFRWLRHAPSLASVTASVGLLVLLEGLTVLRFPTAPSAVSPLPPGAVHFLGATLPEAHLILAALVLAATAVLSIIYRYTRFGLATRAAAESEQDATLLGYSADRLAAVNWVIGAVLAAVFGILIAPITSLEPTGFVLLIVPALAAALVGRFTSFWVTAIAGLVLGCLQTETLHLASVWSWIPNIGTGSVVSFIALALAMMFLGQRLPTRGSVETGRLPTAVRAQRPVLLGGMATIVGIIGVIALHGAYRLSLVTSLVAILVCLSFVVVTGFVGQISLAQLTFAGVAAYLTGELAGTDHWPFLAAAPAAIGVAVVFGLLLGLIALRVRGVNLAIITAGFAAAMSAFVFQNPQYAGGFKGFRVPIAALFGWRLGNGVSVAFGMFCLVVVVVCCALVYRLRISSLGLRMLAVRVNERAAAANGVNVVRTKLTAFAISSALAGAAGVLTAYTQNTVDFTSYGVLLCILLLAGVYIAGIASVGGAVLGGVVAASGVFLYAFSRVVDFGSYQTVVTGVLLIAVAVRNPEGVVGAMSVHWRQMQGRWRKQPGDASPGGAVTSAEEASRAEGQVTL